MWILLALLAVAPRAPQPDAARPTVYWVDGSGDRLQEVAGYRVEGYRDAGRGGLDWEVDGRGNWGGHRTEQLWLFEAPLVATTRLDVPADAVAFMMIGDRNDGWAAFYVDGEPVGAFDMYERGRQTLVVEGLPMGWHTLKVRALGIVHPGAVAAHVAIFGGSALVRDDVVGRAGSGLAPEREAISPVSG